jgi:hypothetical protein
MRRGVLAFLLTFVLGASGVATAGVLSGVGQNPGGASQNPGGSAAHQGETEADESGGGVHGGPIDRFHQAGSCDLTAVSSLPGNWTHGDYVSAVAAGGGSAQIREAAWSECGKPMVSVGHGGGPPAHALKHMAAGKAHAGGESEAPESETSGS